MVYADPADEVNWRENNRDYHKTPDQRLKQKRRKAKLRKEALKDLPDRYIYDISNDKKCKMRWIWTKRKGLRISDFDRTWSQYVSVENCQLCNISLKKVKKNMDHDHRSGYFRFVACHRCNTFLRYRDKYFDNVLNEILQR